jgi:serine/threonine-protein kinase
MLLGKILSNRYELIEIIGQGGMAIVYKAKDKLLNRFVAVKVLRQEFTHDEQFIKKFKRESQSAASLSHQNIVNIYDVGVQEDIHYIVMELVNGKTLKKFIKESIKVNWEKTISIALQIASALEHAHKNHIIHRDIKPHNIIITQEGVAKVADFGIARAITSSTVTQIEDTMGSVHYLSPEQARGGFVNEKSDIYSLGIVMYEMVTGEVPFKGDTSVAVALQHLQGDIKPPKEINESLPESLNSIILKLLKKNPDERYVNATNLINDLNRVYLEPNVNFTKNYFDDNAPTQITPIVEKDNSNNKVSTTKNKVGKNKKIKIVLYLIVFFIMASLIGALVFSFGKYFMVKEIEVPNVENLHIDEAIKKLRDNDLQSEITERKYSSEVEKDLVISQDPGQGKVIKENQIVKLIVSNGPRQIAVPSLIGKFEVEATSLLDNLGFEVGEIKYEFNDDFENGKVFDQSPKEDMEVEEGRKIDLFVSKGKETINTPSIVGKTLEEAKELLNSVGLNIGDIKYESSETYEKDYVIEQNPKAKGEVQKNTVVDIVLSKGKITTKNVEVDLTQYKPEDEENFNVNVTIELLDYQDNTIKTAYEKQHSIEEGLLQIPVQGTGVQIYTVKINGKEYSEGFISF